MSKYRNRRDIRDVLPFADSIICALKEHFSFVELSGSCRRQTSSVGDIDIVVAGKTSSEKLCNIIASCTDIVSSECIDTKIRCCYDVKFHDGVMSIDVWRPLDGYQGAAMLYSTGSTPFNVVMRKWSLYKNMDLRVDGLYDFKTRELISADEIDIFNKLGWEYVDPSDRTQFNPVVRKYAAIMRDWQPDIQQDYKKNTQSVLCAPV